MLLAVQQEEALLTELIDKYRDSHANWTPDVVGRAYGNRGNARSRQGKLEQSLEDYNLAIKICPWSGDPVLNRLVDQQMPNNQGAGVELWKAAVHMCQAASSYQASDYANCHTLCQGFLR